MLTVLNIPNFLTLLRLGAIPLFLILLEDFRFTEALAVFVAAGVTDGLDGAIARMTRTKTTLGAYLDPAADKMLLVSAFIALGFMHEVPRWLVVLVILRDATIVLGYFLLFTVAQRPMEVRPSVSGKASTVLQLSTVAVVLLALSRPGLVHPQLNEAIFYMTGVMTAATGLQYTYRGLAWLQGQPEPGAVSGKTKTERDEAPPEHRRRA